MAGKRYSREIVELCKQYFVKGLTINEISTEMGVDPRTLYNWKNRDNWDITVSADSVEITVARRLNYLVEKDHKTPEELAELSLLMDKFGGLKVQLAEAYTIKSGRAVLPTSVSSNVSDPEQPKNSKPRKKRDKKAKNDVSSVTQDMIMEVLEEHFFKFRYQQLWWERMNDPDTRRNRFILKSRQIGATYYFAFEALVDAILTGDNQIFISASRAQADVFKAYIIAFAHNFWDIDLKGQEVIQLNNGAELRFLSTNANTAQSYHGHLYIDEVFWIPHFEKLEKVSSAMAAHKKWRRTNFSTPSAISHQAYSKWSGEKYNKNRAEDKQVEFDITHKTLKNGQLGADKIWRHIVTVKDAQAQGCDLFDIEELQTEYSKDDFANLFMAKFIDDAKSVFNLGIMMTCYASKDYNDYRADLDRPFGNRPVALGYDPSRVRDNASLCILAIPLRPQDKWRVLKTLDFHGQNFQYQANRIEEIVDTHNVQHIGIDTTGMGYGVFELVEKFYRKATAINYSNETKTSLVMKAIHVIENGRFEYESGHKQITQAFMMITKTVTGNGAMITYSAGRNNAVGHADVAWSIMHALAYESIAPKKKSTVVL